MRFIPWSRAALVAGVGMAMAIPAAVRAQVGDRGAFVVRAGGDTIAVERFTRTPAGVEGEMALPGHARIAYQARTAADASMPSLELRVWPFTAPDTARPLQHLTLTLAGDSAVMAMEGGRTTTAHGTAGAVILVNPSAVMLEQMLLRARALGGRDGATVTVLVTGTPAPVPARVRWVGADSAVLTISGVEMRLRTNAAGRLLGAVVPSQHITIERVAAAPTLGATPPDYSAPAGAPYVAEEVRVPHPGGFQLAGTLTLPSARRGRIPAVVTISGSGQEDRDEAIPRMRRYRPFRQVADMLGRRGIAVLRVDDRGFGASGGNAAQATSQDFATDVQAAVAYLRTRPEIDPERIALLGHSEGGVIGPMVAAADPRIRALVLIAGPSRTGRRILEFQLRNPAEHDTSLNAAARDSVVREGWRMVDSMAARTAWLRFFLDYDPLPTARRVRQPVLVLQGATDQQVTPDQAPELAAAFRAGGNRDVTLRVFPGLNHLMIPDPSGMPANYPSLPSYDVAPQVLGTIADWLAERLR